MRDDIDLGVTVTGAVKAEFVNGTGAKVPFIDRKNLVVYGAADIMARVLGGDTRYQPSHIGFIYGSTGTPGADLVEPPTSRDHTVNTLATELAAVGGNMLAVPLVGCSAYSVDGSESRYSGNSVTVNAFTGTGGEYLFPTTAPYASEMADGSWLWHAMLMSRVQDGASEQYVPFSRVTLRSGGVYRQKPVGFDLSVYWTISFR